eukprot:4843835-Prymnesium_polylepis.1
MSLQQYNSGSQNAQKNPSVKRESTLSSVWLSGPGLRSDAAPRAARDPDAQRRSNVRNGDEGARRQSANKVRSKAIARR